MFADEFDTLDRSVWCPRQWYEGPSPAGSQTVANGELRLRRARTAGNYQNTSMTTEPCNQANSRSFKQGYMEARIRYEVTQGNGPAFWMLSTRHATNPDWPAVNSFCVQGGLPVAECYSGEIDVFEGYGVYATAHTSTIHRNSCGCYGVGNTHRQVSWQHTGQDLSQHHVYSLLWTQNEVRAYLDEQLMGTVAAFDSLNQPMHLILSNWNTPWEPTNLPNLSTEPELDVFVDWVRVWQK